MIKLRRVLPFFLAALLVWTGCASTVKKVKPAPDNVYYVRAGGSDRNDGLSESTPFRSLFKALAAASAVRAQTVVVIGTLDLQSEQTSNDERVFILQGGGRDLVITITGKAGAGGDERAVLSAEGTGRRVALIRGETNLRFENIEISGGSSELQGGGLVIGQGSIVTLGPGATLRNNKASGGGGGVVVIPGGRLFISGAVIAENSSEAVGGGIAGAGEMIVMDSGEVRDNTAPAGGGIAVFDGCVFTLKGGSIVFNRAGLFGGGVAIQNGSADIRGGLVGDNQSALSGGGIGIMNKASLIQSGGEIRRNTAGEHGGGIAGDDSSAISLTGGIIAANRAAQNGGGVFTASAFSKGKGAVITGSGADANNAAAGRALYLYREAPQFIDDNIGEEIVMENADVIESANRAATGEDAKTALDETVTDETTSAEDTESVPVETVTGETATDETDETALDETDETDETVIETGAGEIHVGSPDGEGDELSE
ncbi:MAG: hypothetical protein LBB82_07580 [Treponema sp.]|jgi:hypothetical protein|nr:hypothetical protein [Treponema sp.]